MFSLCPSLTVFRLNFDGSILMNIDLTSFNSLSSSSGLLSSVWTEDLLSERTRIFLSGLSTRAIGLNAAETWDLFFYDLLGNTSITGEGLGSVLTRIALRLIIFSISAGED